MKMVSEYDTKQDGEEEINMQIKSTKCRILHNILIVHIVQCSQSSYHCARYYSIIHEFNSLAIFWSIVHYVDLASVWCQHKLPSILNLAFGLDDIQLSLIL